MNKKYKTSTINKSVLSFVSVFLLSGAAQASSKITVKNDDTTDVTVVVEPGGGGVITTDKNAEKMILKAGEEKTITIKKDQMHQETFSVTGTVTLPSLYNKCGPLPFGKDYKLIFVGGKAGGVVCVRAEL